MPGKTRGGKREQVEQTTGEKIKANQQRLHQQRQQDGLAKWESGDGGKANGADKAVKRYESYRREEQLPREIEQRRVSRTHVAGAALTLRSASTNNDKRSFYRSTDPRFPSTYPPSKTSPRSKRTTESFFVSTFSLQVRLPGKSKTW